MNATKDKLAIIVGPTASGKTAVSVNVARILNAEIISGDSMQVYRCLDIGTAKISPDEMAGITHHLLNIRQPEDDFSVADFRKEAIEAIRDINGRGKLALVVGGTGLYISSLVNPYLFPPGTAKDNGFRAQKLLEAGQYGPEFLHKHLAQLDPEAALRIHPNDHYRVVRALEVYQQTGRTISEIQQQSRRQDGMPAFSSVICGLMLRRELLYPRIEQRVEQMLDDGLIEEVRNVLAAGVPLSATSMQGLGYRHMAAYLSGLCTLEEAVNMLKRDTRRFAKRQYTWFKRDKGIHWFDVEKYLNSNHYPDTERLARDIAACIRRELGEVH